MSLQPLKPWRSFADQLQQLQTRGLQVENTASALDYLERLGYYRLSGYWYPLRRLDTAASQVQQRPVRLDTFVADSHFEDVVRLYVFDKKLRLLALDALERIEMAVRVDIAHLLGQRDPLAHTKTAYLDGNFTRRAITHGKHAGKTEHQVWLETYESHLKRAKKEPFVAHHLQQYGELPIWVAVEVWDFGLLSKLFAGMRYADQQQIAALYGAADGKTFAQWLRSLNFIRNVSAHHSRLWNINVVERSRVPQDWPAQLNNNRPFLYFCLMQQFLSVICPNSSWGQRLIKLLEEDFPDMPHQQITRDDFGTFQNWAEWKLWQK